MLILFACMVALAVLVLGGLPLLLAEIMIRLFCLVTGRR